MRISDWSSDVCSSDLKRDMRRAKFDGDTLAEQFDHKPHQRHRVHRQTGEIVNLDPVAASQLEALLRELARQIQKTDLARLDDNVARRLALRALLGKRRRQIGFRQKQYIGDRKSVV